MISFSERFVLYFSTLTFHVKAPVWLWRQTGFIDEGFASQLKDLKHGGLWGWMWVSTPCAWTSERRSHTDDRHRSRCPAGHRWGCQSCASCPCLRWTGTGAQRRPRQARRSRANLLEASPGWWPGEERWGSCIRTGCKGCAGRKHCRSPAARGGGPRWTCGRRMGRIRMRRRRRRSSRLRLASRTEAERLGRSPADRRRRPSCLRSHCRHCHQSGMDESHLAYQQQSRRKSSVAGRIQRAEQRPQRPLQPGGVRRNCRPGRHSPAGPPCCYGHRLGTQTGPGCRADFPCSPHWRCWEPGGRWGGSRRGTGGAPHQKGRGFLCWRWWEKFLCFHLENTQIQTEWNTLTPRRCVFIPVWLFVFNQNYIKTTERISKSEGGSRKICF